MVVLVVGVVLVKEARAVVVDSRQVKGGWVRV